MVEEGMAGVTPPPEIMLENPQGRPHLIKSETEGSESHVATGYTFHLYRIFCSAFSSEKAPTPHRLRAFSSETLSPSRPFT